MWNSSMASCSPILNRALGCLSWIGPTYCSTLTVHYREHPPSPPPGHTHTASPSCPAVHTFPQRAQLLHNLSPLPRCFPTSLFHRPFFYLGNFYPNSGAWLRCCFQLSLILLWALHCIVCIHLSQPNVLPKMHAYLSCCGPSSKPLRAESVSNSPLSPQLREWYRVDTQ